MKTFTAIDFETADHGRDSACSVAAVLVENGRIVERYHQLIKPPRREFRFTWIHHISWEDVRRSPSFRTIWPDLRALIDNSEFLVAHNAGFDRSVLQACCSKARLRVPAREFICTLQLSRKTWPLPSHRLPVVCDHLGIPLDHHNALSDAEACAEIAIRAMR